MTDKLNKTGSIICRLPNSKNYGLFTNPKKIIEINNPANINKAIDEIQDAVDNGKYAAGFISYEAAIAFDSAFHCKELDNFPYLYFGIYDSFTSLEELPTEKYSLSKDFFKPEISEEEYTLKIQEILEHIKNGNIYQANFTIRLFGESIVFPEKLFLSLASNHPVPYASYINTGSHKIVSISPELFVERNDENITSLPMKGTTKRKPSYHADIEQAIKLSNSIKDRAENVMIVDMVRNDFGRICDSGSIYVDPLFHVDTYKTLHQMISKVHGSISEDTKFSKILKATFPAASITGAPKIRATQIIEKLENAPREIYTGSIGCILPNNQMCFNVAIRTLICTAEKTELSVGSGIIADSNIKSEWKECLLKSNFASCKTETFNLIETILYRSDIGFVELDAHIQRAKQSSAYFHRVFPEEKLRQKLKDFEKHMLKEIEEKPKHETIKYIRIRLEISEGDIETSCTDILFPSWGEEKTKVLISKERVNSKNIFLYHKTTQRQFYDEMYMKALDANYNEVIFTNENGFVTEGCISNIFVLKDGKWKTPQISCGLLPGIWRAKMIKELNAQEDNITLNDLKNADEVMICNSVRGSTTATLC
jgi:para-aminobenzoate synthetase/4-amino-4-deoxychorismate lyase